MRGAIFYNGKYGSTEQYARWIGEASNLPVFNCKDPKSDPSQFDFLILGSSVIFFRLTIRKWIRKNLMAISGKPTILFSVSGAGESEKLSRWVSQSLPKNLHKRIEHIALGGRMDHSKLSWGMRKFMMIGSLFNPDPKARKEERHGFDHMDKNSIKPIVHLIRQFQDSKVEI